MNSLLDDVNALLKLKQGDLGRLEHIKATLESRNVLYISDTKYLRELTREYLEDHKGQRLERFNSYDYPEYTNRLKETPVSEPERTSEEEKEAEQMAKNLKEAGDISEDVKKSIPEIIESNKNYFCGNCGNMIKNENFCRKCGSSLYIIEEEEKQYDEKFRKNESQEKISTKNEVKISKSTLVIIILFGVIIVGGIAMGIKILGENEIQIGNEVDTTPVQNTIPVSDEDSSSKCGIGTVFDEVSNSCVLEGSKISNESNSKCGIGTVFDEVSNSCVLE
ncbi:MAG: hypothetical protein COA77_04740 [Thaumarchaeota archaeon]|nr:MAG: hypothetical protein COA77_04740 [Nitrososphaerota archaeon]